MKGLFTRILLVLVFLALLANLLAYLLGGESLASEHVLYWAVAAGGTLVGVVVNGAGIRYTSKGLRKREKSSFLWARRGFIVGFTIVLLVAADAVTSNQLLIRDVRGDPGSALWRAGLVLLLLSAGPLFFAIAFQREYRRTAAREAAVLSGRE
jgi:membrane protease YdiL (CAAX protease family)